MSNHSIAQIEFVKANKRHKKIVSILRIIILIAFIAVWEIAARTGLIDDFIFSSPYRILICFINMVKTGAIFFHTGVTVMETLLSFLLVMFFGILISILLWRSKKVSEILEPYLVVLNSLPKSALAPILIVWLGNNIKTIIVVAISVAIFTTILIFIPASLRSIQIKLS